MTEIWEGFTRALELIFTLDGEVLDVAGRSLFISGIACVITAVITIPLGALVHFNNFRGKHWVVSLIQTFYSLPTVLVGLLVFISFSSSGPLGELDLLFTPMVMIIGQVVLITPLMMGLVISALSGVDKGISETAVSLGASPLQAGLLTIREARYAVTTAVIMGFGRAISEVGLALMVGGNIRGFTRTLTTAISLETSKGDLEFSMALGVILLIIALVVNISVNRLQRKT